MLGKTVSHYRIVAHIGQGGMGVVYRAEDTRLGRQVAIKFLPPAMAANREALERFKREARAASALNHPNICTVFDIGEDDGQPFMVMELLEGETLSAHMSGKPLPTAEVIELPTPRARLDVAMHARRCSGRRVPRPLIEEIAATLDADAAMLAVLHTGSAPTALDNALAHGHRPRLIS